MSKHILETILNTQEPDLSIVREFEELKTALAPLLDPSHKSGIPMRIQYAPKPDNAENVPTTI
jgi:hypothetical protein